MRFIHYSDKRPPSAVNASFVKELIQNNVLNLTHLKNIKCLCVIKDHLCWILATVNLKIQTGCFTSMFIQLLWKIGPVLPYFRTFNAIWSFRVLDLWLRLSQTAAAVTLYTTDTYVHYIRNRGLCCNATRYRCIPFTVTIRMLLFMFTSNKLVFSCIYFTDVWKGHFCCL